MDFVSPIITPIVQSLMVPIKKHLGFLISSTKYVKKMDAKMKQLKDTAQEVQATWNMALGNTEVVPERVEPWLQDVKSLNERCNLIEAVGCFNIAKRYKVGKQSYDILEEIKDLENRESKIVFTHTQKPLADIGSTSTGPSTSILSPMGTQYNFESRDLIFNDALHALKSDNESQKMIALCGMGGVGKTTMMEQLKKAVEDLKMFSSVVKVVIGENTDTISLQQAIAQYIGNDLTETTRDARADRLRKIFEVKHQQGQKKILVIMDDLWNEINLTDLGLSPLPSGFKLLFTSRFEDICTRMGVRTQSIFKIRVLSNIEATTLFSRIVEPCPLDGDDDELHKIGEEIVTKCGGLPIAIITIAKILSGNIKGAWKETLSNLQNHDLQDLDEIVHKVFEMSYNSLKKEDDKAVFLLSGLFPDDVNIPIEDLMKYGWGLRLFTEVHTIAQARRRANVCVNNLIRANLLTESDRKGCVKMHDLVRAFVLSNFSKVKQASILNHKDMLVQPLTKDASDCYDRVLFKCNGMVEFPTDFSYPNVSFLMLTDGFELLKFPSDMYKKMEKLEVVAYEKMSIPLLPRTFEHSTKLRTLCVRSCLLMDDISFLEGLYNLEILSLVDCKLIRLPSTIGNLKKLKLLNLTGCINLYIDDGVFQNLVNLEELYIRALKGRRVWLTHANWKELEKLSQRLIALELEFFSWTSRNHSVLTHNKPQLKNMCFKSLERFKISIGCEFETEVFGNYSFKNELKLEATCNELHECNISDLFEETEDLKLQVKDMYNLEDVSMHHTFSQLKVFHVSKCENLTCLFTVVVASSLKKLEQLIISDCCVLKALISEKSEVGLIKFPNLKLLSLERLPEMVKLCDDGIELPKLMELRLHALPNFTSIFPDNDNDLFATQPLLNREVMVPKLEKLDVYMMKNLKHIWPCQNSTSGRNDISILRQIGVRECDSLVNLFPINPLPLLNDLEDLVVRNCGSIEVLFNIDFEGVSEMREYNSKLRSIRVGGLQKLKELWRIKGLNNSDILINCFKGVQSIEIECCMEFTHVFTPPTINFDLDALSTYITRETGCDVKEGFRKNKLLTGRDHEINVTYPSDLLRTFHHLQNLTLVDDARVEIVFEMDHSPCIRRTIQHGHPPLLLPHLEVIRLERLKNMSHVWKCNWNKFLHPHSLTPFQNLVYVSLHSCHKMKYLFSPLMLKLLSNLKDIFIDGCDGIEEVISSRDDHRNEENDTSTSSNKNSITLFPHLDNLRLSKLSCLKSIDDDQTRSRSKSDEAIGVCWSLCQFTKKIDIYKCDALSRLVPWYAVGQMKRLEDLRIWSCKTLTEVFESEVNNNVHEGSASGYASPSPTLKNSTTLVVCQLSNLKNLSIVDCDIVQHIFTFSVLESLSQLKHLNVRRCNAIQVIVKEENEMTSLKVVVFPRLETLELDHLPNLKGFFLGKNDFRWPLLDNVMISDCPQLTMFISGHSDTPKLKFIRTSFGKYSSQCGLDFQEMVNQTTFTTCSSSNRTISKGMPWSFYYLIEINMRHMNVDTTIIPSNVLLQLEKLEKINIDTSNGLKEIFEVVALEASGFNESQTVIKIPSLKQVYLRYVDDLKYLWKSNQWTVLEFPNLTTLSIDGCNKLEHVFTCSMIGSLLQLQDLMISCCNIIEVIVKEEKCNEKVNEIMLPCLKSLILCNLPSLKGFCLGKEAFSLPALDTLQIKCCLAITVFTKGNLSTPRPIVVDTDYGMCAVAGDVNSFLETKQKERCVPVPRTCLLSIS